MVKRRLPGDARREIPAILTRRGYRLTGPRRAVLDVLSGATEPLTVAQIHRRLAGQGANLVSVYRTVHLLTGAGVLRETDAPRGERRYELTEEFTGHHHHLICRSCGRIEDLDGCLLQAAALSRVGARVRHSRGFRITDHELRLFGVCRTCEP